MVELTLSHLLKTLALQKFCTNLPMHLGALLRFAPRWAASVERPAGLRMTKGTGTLRTSSFAELAPSGIVELAGLSPVVSVPPDRLRQLDFFL